MPLPEVCAYQTNDREGRSMRGRLFHHLRGHFVGYLALFFALGGTSFAAVQALPRNTVGSAQIKNGSIRKVDIGKRTVSALRGLRGLRGLQGATGAQGSKGDTGAKGADFTADTTLASGKTLTGSWGVGGGLADGLVESVQFRLPLVASPGGSFYIPNPAGYTGNCPGPGRAAAGQLCVYRDEGSGTATFSAIYSDEGGASSAGAGKTGFLISFTGGAVNTYVSGDWAITAP
jgi:hypothetical protein